MGWSGEERRKCPTTCQTGVLEHLTQLQIELSRINEVLRHEEAERLRIHKENHEILRHHNEVLFGNGKEGLLVEFTRMKQVVAILRWISGTIGTVLIGIGMNWFIHH